MPRPRHIHSHKLIENRLFAGLSCFADLEKRISALATPHERGAAFEVFAEAYLATQRVPQAKEVWPIGTESLELRQRLVLPAKDKGIDGLILAEDDQFTAYQVKFRQDRQTLLWDDLGNFFGLADRVPQRLVFTNSYEVGETATERLGFMAVRGSDLDELDSQDFAVIEAWLSGEQQTRKLASPGKHQMEAISSIRQGLQNGDRALALMACGSGKTLTALWVTEQMGVKTVLILLPSLALVRQTLHEWLRHTSWPRGGMSYICVCSDTTVDRDSDEIQVRPGDLDFPVTTDPSVLNSFLNREYDGVRLVFSTYQSLKVVIEASSGMSPFDLGIFDEAHKTAGRPELRFGLALDDKNVLIRKRLFMTATPRHYTIAQRDKEGEAKLLFSMDVPEVYGPVVYSLPFTDAVKAGIICGYRIVISVVTSKMVTDEAIRRSIVIVDGDEVKARQVANQIALASVVQKYGIKKAFTFHTSVSSAKSFVTDGPEGIATHLPQFQALHVNGSMNTADREKVMKAFRQASEATLSNARCLTEGVDVPAVDLVAFMAPKRSLVDIVQATGRAMRKSEGKVRGYIIVPLYVEQARGESVEQAVLRSDFSEVWRVIDNLKQVDDVLAHEISAMRQEKGRTGGYDDSRSREPFDILGPELSLDQLRASITAKCLEDVGDPWDERYGQLLAYWEIHGTTEIPARSKDQPLLAKWIVNQRVARRANKLSAERIALLDKLGFNWNPNHAEWRTRYLDLVEYKRVNGHCNVPQTLSKGGLALASWLSNQRMERRRGLLDPERERLLTNLGVEWNRAPGTWEMRFQELLKYKEEHGHCRVPARSPKNKLLAGWVVKQRVDWRKGKISAERKQRMDAIGFQWKVSNDVDETWAIRLAQLKEFHQQHGHSRVTRENETSSGLASWVQAKRSAQGTRTMTEEQKAVLSQLGFWREAPRDSSGWDSMYAALRQYKLEFGDTLVPFGWEVNPSLATWVGRNRTAKRRGELEPHKIAQLDALGFDWEPKVVRWSRMMDALRAFVKANGHCSVPWSDRALSSWLSGQRAALKSGRLTQAQAKALNELGILDSSFTERWEHHFPILREYFRLHGHCDIARSHPQIDDFPEWMAEVRAARKAGKLVQEQVLQLDAIGFDWNAEEPDWETRLEQLRASRSSPLHEKASALLPGLDKWIVHIRNRRHDGLLDDDQIELLNAQGFVWEPGAYWKWDELYERLRHYHAQHGHSSVPIGDEGDPVLARWVQTQRLYFKRGSLDADKVAKLNALKFDWSPTETNWQRRMAQLKTFRQKHGHCDVPEADEHLSLSRWTDYVRNRQSEGLLDADRKAELDALGFSWESARLPGWDAQFARLLEYRAQHGDVLVPFGYPEDPALARWVQTQRMANRRGDLPPDRRQKLIDVGLDWNPHDTKWNGNFAKLSAFHKSCGHWDPPGDSSEMCRLATWIDIQRSAHRKGQLSPDRVKALNELGFPWSASDQKWEEFAVRLQGYIQRHNEFPGGSKARNERGLMRWIATQRRDKTDGLLSEERVQRLTAMGFQWEKSSQPWEQMFEQARSFHAEHGNLDVPRREQWRKLAEWVSSQRTAKRSGLLEVEKQTLLESINITWEFEPKGWDVRFGELQKYKERFGDCDVPYEWPEGIELSRWLTKQRLAYTRGQLEAGKQRKLTELGVDWKSRRDQWDGWFDQLVEFKNKNGHLIPSYFIPETKRLSTWCTSQRKAQKEGRLPKEREERLTALGFQWAENRIRGDEYWDLQYQSMVEFQKEHGHCNVPGGWRDREHPNDKERQLANWCFVQTRTWREGKLKPERYEKLSQLGFEWRPAAPPTSLPGVTKESQGELQL